MERTPFRFSIESSPPSLTPSHLKLLVALWNCKLKPRCKVASADCLELSCVRRCRVAVSLASPINAINDSSLDDETLSLSGGDSQPADPALVEHPKAIGRYRIETPNRATSYLTSRTSPTSSTLVWPSAKRMSVAATRQHLKLRGWWSRNWGLAQVNGTTFAFSSPIIVSFDVAVPHHGLGRSTSPCRVDWATLLSCSCLRCSVADLVGSCVRQR